MRLWSPFTTASALLSFALACTSCSTLLDLDSLQEGTPDGTVIDSAVAEAGRDGAPEDRGADAPLLDQALPDQLLPDQALPDQLLFDLALPDLALPDLALPDLALPDQLVPDQLVPDQLAPDQALPDLAAPDQAVVDQAAGDQTTTDLQADLVAPDTSAPDTSTPDSAPDSAPDSTQDGSCALDGCPEVICALVSCTVQEALGGPSITPSDIIEAVAVIDPPAADIQLRWTLSLVEPGHPQEGILATSLLSTTAEGRAIAYYNLSFISPPISPGSARLLSRWEFVQTADGSNDCLTGVDIASP